MSTCNNQWRVTNLGSLITIKHGYAFKGRFFADSGHYILLTPGNFNPTGGIKLKGSKEKYYNGPFPKDFLLKQGDLLVVMTDLTQNASILGSPAFIPKSNTFLHNQRLGKIQCVNLNINKEFLYYLFNSPPVRAQIRGSATGSTVRHTAPERIYSVRAPIPPLATQRKIAAILSAYDDLIENNLRRIKILEEMAQNLYREWFVKFRFPGHEQARFVDSEMGRIPEGWEWVSFGDIIEPKRGKTITKKTIIQGNVPVVAGGLQPAYFHNESNTNNPVITISASGANAGFVNLYHEAVWASDCSYIDSSMTSHVYYFFLLLQYRQIEITGMQRGAAQPHVYPKDLARLCVLKVPDCTLNLFDHHITPAFALIRDLNHKNINLRHTRDLLLPRLISGEVDVSELDINIPNENGI